MNFSMYTDEKKKIFTIPDKCIYLKIKNRLFIDFLSVVNRKTVQFNNENMKKYSFT